MMELIGKTVKHIKYGEGVVISQKAGQIQVRFESRSEIFASWTLEKGILQLIGESVRGLGESERQAKIQLLKKLHSLGFEGFLHTTEIENFKKIVQDGYLFPRAKLVERGTDFVDRADQGVIKHTNFDIKNACRFYYYFCTPTNYLANYQKPVIMVFHEDIIFYKKDFVFFYGNAASAYSYCTESVKQALAWDWDLVFERGSYFDSKLTDSNMITRIRNSEFIVKGSISIDNIAKVYFKTESDMREAKRFCSELLCKKFVVDRSRFN